MMMLFRLWKGWPLDINVKITVSVDEETRELLKLLANPDMPTLLQGAERLGASSTGLQNIVDANKPAA